MELFLNNNKLTQYLREWDNDAFPLKNVKDRPLTKAIERYVYACREDMIAYSMMWKLFLPSRFSTLNEYLYKATFVSTDSPEVPRFLYGVASVIDGEEIHIPMLWVTRYPNTGSETLQRYYGDEMVVATDIELSSYDRHVVFDLSQGMSINYIRREDCQ